MYDANVRTHDYPLRCACVIPMPGDSVRGLERVDGRSVSSKKYPCLQTSWKHLKFFNFRVVHHNSAPTGLSVVLQPHFTIPSTQNVHTYCNRIGITDCFSQSNFNKPARPFVNMMQWANKSTSVDDAQSLRYNIRLFIVTCAPHLRLFTGACSQVCHS